MIGYEFHPDAEAEYLEAVVYYSSIDSELGSSFVEEIKAELRHVLTHRFSYSIIYEILPERIFIWALTHSSRKPGYWKERLNP